MTVDNTQPVGENPINIEQVEYLGLQRSNNSASHRDLGFTGQLGGKWYAVYGDTLWCDAGVTDPSKDTDGFHGMVRNSLSALTDDALVVHDLHLNDDDPVPHQNQLVPFREEWGETNLVGFGGTGIVETDAETSTGALYILVVCSIFHKREANPEAITNTSPQNDAEHYKGAGIAKIEIINDVPTVTHRPGDQGWWWNGDEVPKYGDVATYKDVHSDYIYLFGNPPNTEKEWPAKFYVYMARVRAADAFDLDRYEYWWGREQGWKTEVLTRCDCETAVMWGVGQGQIVWNDYYKTYIYVHLDMGKQVVCYFYIKKNKKKTDRLTEYIIRRNCKSQGCSESRRSMDRRQRGLQG